WLDRLTPASRTSYKSSVSFGNTLYATSMECEEHGDRCTGHDEAHLGAGWLFKGSPFEVTWSHIDAADDDTCWRTDVDRPSRISGLTFGGRTVFVTGRPSQTLTIAGVTLILNESKHGRDPGESECEDEAEHRSIRLLLPHGNEVRVGCLDLHRDDLCC